MLLRWLFPTHTPMREDKAANTMQFEEFAQHSVEFREKFFPG